MFGFSFGKKNAFLGIDIGTSAIKIVELKLLSGKPALSNYAVMPLSPVGSQELENEEYFESILPGYIRKMLKEAKFETDQAYVSLPAFGGLITLIEFPEMSRDDMEQAIRFEAQKYIPTSLNDVVLSWDIVGGNNPNGQKKSGATKEDDVVLSGSSEYKNLRKTQVLLVAASRSKVNKYEKLIAKSGLKLQSLELESFSMANALLGKDPGRFIIIDIGSRICNIIFVEDGMIKVSRNIDAGGRDITDILVKSMGVNEERAEALKISSKNFFSSESGVSFPVLNIISGEVSRIINNLDKNNQKKGIEGIILSGGTANLHGLAEYLSGLLGQKVIMGNPFSRIEYDKQLDDIIGKSGVQFSVCIGLAMRGFDNIK